MSYEQQQINAIRVWQGQSPKLSSVLLGMAFAPATKLVDIVIPQSALHAALEAACSAGEKLASPEAVLLVTERVVVTTAEPLRYSSTL